jgi:integrase
MLGKITKSAVDQLAPGDWLWDADHREVVKGFGVRRQVEGVFYCLRYRLRGKQRVYSIGRHGSPWTPDTARAEAKRLLGKVVSGVDPLSERRNTRDEDRTAKTFDKEAERYLARRKEAMKPRVFRELQRHFNDHAKPLHRLRLDEIRKAKIAEMLNDIQDERGPTARNRFRSNLSAFFTWAVAQGFLETNPVEGTAKAAENGPRERVLTPAELTEVWTALGTDDFSNIVRLLILTGQRREEIGGLRWNEVDLDRDLIVLPPERTKNKRQHELPLSSQAQMILEQRKASGVVARFANTSPVFGEGPNGFVGWGHSKARFNERLAAQRKKGGAKPMPDWTLHDLRRTAATMMAELGVLPHIIEAILNHISGHKSGVAGVYNRAKYEGEMREALCKWADYVEGLANTGATVTRISA